MNKKIKVNTKTFKDINDLNLTQIILDDSSIENKDIVIFENNGEEIFCEITAKNKYNSLDDCFKIIPFDLFGKFKDIEEAKKNYSNITSINVYRLKIYSDTVKKIESKKILELIDKESLIKNTVGHSSSEVYEVKLKDGKDAILKVQYLSTRNSLIEEYKRIKWLQDKCNVPKIYHYEQKNNTKYLLMEKKKGVSAHKTENFAYKIGRQLREIHDLDIQDCLFKQNTINKLMKNALDNIDIIYPQVHETYSDMTKEDVIRFIKKYKPKDKVLVHGDYSLPNILIDEEGNIGLIDLGDVSISTKYFDLFYLKKSLIRNKKIDKLDEFLKGYGMTTIDDNYMKWMEIIDRALF